MVGSLLGTVIRAVQSICLWVPVVFAVSLFAEAYYAYVFVFCGLFVKENALCFALATVFHLLLFFCLWSFAQTTFTSPARVPPYFHISEDERRNLAHAVRNPTRRAALLEAMAAKRGVLTRAADGSVNYCDPCQRIKPDRCHHCSSCERCILKMDHHCPWFNNCVCYNTYKFFLLTLFYIELLCVYVFFSVSVYVWKRKHHQLLQSMHTVFLVTLGASSFLSIGSFLCLHLTLLSRNCTTLESSRPPNFKERGDSFDLGTPRNFTEVFGQRAELWLVPLFTSPGDGSRFPTRFHPDRDSHAPRTAAPAMNRGRKDADSALSTTATTDTMKLHGTAGHQLGKGGPLASTPPLAATPG
ncbi:palmitoyltransferase ZDHHC20-B [Rhipicephalus sanguineus]|uniref:palmitoyltransferase ZDHHC20-B n=1 Tax=Rhipicephalus sanguineus TaxID=34632 RepID=UPI001896185E|nr:palmitoyltransferase ZDHHC20-B [Rhipicephalus sanguineus]